MIALLVAANMMWGSGWVVAKFLLTGMLPLQVAAWRMIVAGLLILPLTLHHVRRGLLPPRLWPQLLFLALIGFVLPKALNLWGVDFSTATSAALLMGSEPLFTLLLGVLLLRERLNGARLAALALGTAGSYLIVARGWGLPDWRSLQTLGDLIFMAGLALESWYTVAGKASLARMSPLVVTAATISASLVFWLPVAAWDIAARGWPAASPGAAAGIAYLAIGLTLVGYWIWLAALQHIDAGHAGLSIFVQPLFGAALSVTLLAESITSAMAVGGALILLSLGLALRVERT